MKISDIDTFSKAAAAERWRQDDEEAAELWLLEGGTGSDKY